MFSSCLNLPVLIALPIRSSARSLWDAMLTSKHKEGVIEVRRQLVEAASKENLPIKMSMGKNHYAVEGAEPISCFTLIKD